MRHLILSLCIALIISCGGGGGGGGSSSSGADLSSFSGVYAFTSVTVTSGSSARLNALAAGESITINLPDNQYYMAMDMSSGSEIMYLTDLTGEECADKLTFSNTPTEGKSTDVTPEWEGTYTSCIVKWLEEGVGVARTSRGDSVSNGQTNNGLGSNMATTVQLPTFATVSVTTTVSVPDGGSILLGGIKRWSETTPPSILNNSQLLNAFIFGHITFNQLLIFSRWSVTRDGIPYLLSNSITLERDGCTFNGNIPGQYDDSIPGFNPNVNTPVSFTVSGTNITGFLLGLGLSGSTNDWNVTGSQDYTFQGLDFHEDVTIAPTKTLFDGQQAFIQDTCTSSSVF